MNARTTVLQDLCGRRFRLFDTYDASTQEVTVESVREKTSGGVCVKLTTLTSSNLTGLLLHPNDEVELLPDGAILIFKPEGDTGLRQKPRWLLDPIDVPQPEPEPTMNEKCRNAIEAVRHVMNLPIDGDMTYAEKRLLNACTGDYYTRVIEPNLLHPGIHVELDGADGMWGDLTKAEDIATLTWNMTPPEGISFTEHRLSFVDMCARAERELFAVTRTRSPNLIYVSHEAFTIIQFLPGFVPNGEKGELGTLNGWKILSLVDTGKADTGMDFYMPSHGKAVSLYIVENSSDVRPERTPWRKYERDTDHQRLLVQAERDIDEALQARETGVPIFTAHQRSLRRRSAEEIRRIEESIALKAAIYGERGKVINKWSRRGQDEFGLSPLRALAIATSVKDEKDLQTFGATEREFADKLLMEQAAVEACYTPAEKADLLRNNKQRAQDMDAAGEAWSQSLRRAPYTPEGIVEEEERAHKIKSKAQEVSASIDRYMLTAFGQDLRALHGRSAEEELAYALGESDKPDENSTLCTQCGKDCPNRGESCSACGETIQCGANGPYCTYECWRKDKGGSGCLSHGAQVVMIEEQVKKFKLTYASRLDEAARNRLISTYGSPTEPRKPCHAQIWHNTENEHTFIYIYSGEGMRWINILDIPEDSNLRKAVDKKMPLPVSDETFQTLKGVPELANIPAVQVKGDYPDTCECGSPCYKGMNEIDCSNPDCDRIS